MRASRLRRWMTGTVVAASSLGGASCLPYECGDHWVMALDVAEVRAYADQRFFLSEDDCEFLCNRQPLTESEELITGCSRPNEDELECHAARTCWSGPFVAVPGRRTAGLLSPARPGSMGGYLARAAYFEAASVGAFRRLGHDLARFGAPRRLQVACARAGLDERRHARVTSALARELGVVPEVPRFAEVPERTPLEVARENVTEGVVGESWAALEAHWQARHTPDPRLSRAFAGIAHDEAAHAALSFELDRWFADTLGPSAARELGELRHASMRSLGVAEPDVDSGAAGALGLPTGDDRRALGTALRGLLARAA